MKKKVCVVCKDGVVEMMMEENEISSLLDQVTGNETTDWEAFEKYSKIKDVEIPDCEPIYMTLTRDLKELYNKYKNYLYVTFGGDRETTITVSFSRDNLYNEYKDWHKRKAHEVSKKYGMEEMN